MSVTHSKWMPMVEAVSQPRRVPIPAIHAASTTRWGPRDESEVRRVLGSQAVDSGQLGGLDYSAIDEPSHLSEYEVSARVGGGRV